MKKALLITAFLILIPYISAQGQETDSLEILGEQSTTLDFKVGSISNIAVNFEKVLRIDGNTAVIRSFGPAYIRPWVTMDGTIFDEAQGPSIQISWSRLSGSVPYHLRDTHFEISGGIYFGMTFIDYTKPKFAFFHIYPKFSLGTRHQSPTSDVITRVYIGFLSVGFSVGSK